MLNRIIKKKNLTVIGLNSGTSADGLDLAAVKIDISKRPIKVKFIKGATVPYPKRLYVTVNDAVCGRQNSIDDLIDLDRTLGCFYGEQAYKFSNSLIKEGTKPDLIASHGQTVRHLPGRIKIDRKFESGTLQLGHPESIAHLTGLVTISDFRQFDIALGGEGAPITCLAMWHMFSSRKESRMLINIGGIANFFLFPGKAPAEKTVAADCGPGNSLLDIITARFFGKKYDRSGALASKGNISLRLLSVLLSDNFLKGRYGPSTGRERFGEKYARRIIGYGKKLGLSNHDILATTAELTAVGIANSIGRMLSAYGLDKIYLLGGGAKNKFLLKRLACNLPGAEFFSVDRLGYDSDYLEAACYAVMGAMTLGGMPSTLAHITGAKEDTIAGRIVQPPKK